MRHTTCGRDTSVAAACSAAIIVFVANMMYKTRVIAALLRRRQRFEQYIW